MSGWRTTQNQTAVIHIQNLARLPQRTSSSRRSAASVISNLCKQKTRSLTVSGLLARREGFEPPAFWSVRLSQAQIGAISAPICAFTAVHSADFPLFPSRLARSGSVLGQKWVKDRCMAGEFEQSVRIHTERLIGQQLFFFQRVSVWITSSGVTAFGRSCKIENWKCVYLSG